MGKIEPIEFEDVMWGIFDAEGDEGDAPLAILESKSQAEGLRALVEDWGCAAPCVHAVRLRGIWGNDPDTADVAPAWK